MKHSELRHQPRHVNPRIQDTAPFVIVRPFLFPQKIGPSDILLSLQYICSSSHNLFVKYTFRYFSLFQTMVMPT